MQALTSPLSEMQQYVLLGKPSDTTKSISPIKGGIPHATELVCTTHIKQTVPPIMNDVMCYIFHFNNYVALTINVEVNGVQGRTEFYVGEHYD